MAFRISEAAKIRCAEQLRAEQKVRSADLQRRLTALTAEHGPDSLYAEMLEDHIRRNGKLV